MVPGFDMSRPVISPINRVRIKQNGITERYAQHRADERAVTAHKSVAPLDSLS
jgi:hypothetical protein